MIKIETVITIRLILLFLFFSVFSQSGCNRERTDSGERRRGPAKQKNVSKVKSTAGRGKKTDRTARAIGADHPVVESVDPAGSYIYVMEVESPQGARARAEVLVDGARKSLKASRFNRGKWATTLHMIMDEDHQYLLYEEDLVALKLPIPADQAGELLPPEMFLPEWETYQDEHEGAVFEKTGIGEINGREVVVYEVKDPGGEGMTVVYVDEAGMTLKREAYDGDGGLVSVMKVIRLESNPDRSDSDFKPPPEYTMKEFSTMMPDLPGRAKSEKP